MATKKKAATKKVAKKTVKKTAAKPAVKKASKKKAAKVKKAPDRATEHLLKAGLKAKEAAVFREQWLVMPLDKDLIKRARSFVTGNADGWDHDKWVTFVDGLKADGFNMGQTPQAERLASMCLGILVESIHNNGTAPKKASKKK